MNALNDLDFDADDYYPDDPEYQSYSSREVDNYEALLCLEEALQIAATLKNRERSEKLSELLNKAYFLLDRHYGEDGEYSHSRELNFNDDNGGGYET